MKESDWKLFKKIKDEALQKFCSNVLKGVSETIGTQESSAHERYLQMYDKVRESDKELGQIFDGLSRSKAHLQLLMIRSKGLANQRLIGQLSKEFQNETDPSRLG